MKTRTLITKVAGVTFEGRQAHLARLTGKEPVRIVPEPENPYDPNALAVHVAIAPGEVVMASIREITGGFETSNGETASLGLRIMVEFPDEMTAP